MLICGIHLEWMAATCGFTLRPRGESTKTPTDNLTEPGLGLWNKFWAVTLLYGGITTLGAIELDRVFGVFPFLRKLDDVGLLVLIVAAGTVGMHILHKHVVKPEEWRQGRWFAIGLTASLAVAAAAVGSVLLAQVCVMVLGMHAVLPIVLHD